MYNLVKYIYLLISLTLFSCSNNLNNFSEDNLLNVLTESYNKNSEEKYLEFLTIWNKEIHPIGKTELANLSTKEKNIYQLFSDIYDPTQYYERDMTYKYGHYSEDKFLVLQNKVYFYEIMEPTDTLLWLSRYKDKFTLKKDSISNFRPVSDYNSDKIVYLSDKYDRILNKFLYGILSDTNAFQRIEYITDSAKIEIENKVKFLNKMVHLENNHWVATYWFLTFPVIDVLTISSDYRKVIVEKRNTFASGKEIEYHLIKNHWIEIYDLGDWEE